LAARLDRLDNVVREFRHQRGGLTSELTRTPSRRSRRESVTRFKHSPAALRIVAAFCAGIGKV